MPIPLDPWESYMTWDHLRSLWINPWHSHWNYMHHSGLWNIPKTIGPTNSTSTSILSIGILYDLRPSQKLSIPEVFGSTHTSPIWFIGIINDLDHHKSLWTHPRHTLLNYMNPRWPISIPKVFGPTHAPYSWSIGILYDLASFQKSFYQPMTLQPELYAS